MLSLVLAAALAITPKAPGTLSPTSDLSTNRVRATGSTSYRALRDRFAEVKNVLDFGALGDNSHDDGPAIQAAINATGIGGAVFLPGNRTYRTTQQINIQHKDSLHLIGGGMGNTAIRYAGPQSATVAVLYIQHSSYAVVEGILFTSQNGSSYNPLDGLAGFGVYITNEGMNNGGITQYNEIRNCRAQFNSVAGFQIGNIGNNNTDSNVDGNTIIESFAAFNGNGIRIYQTNANLTKIEGGAIAQNYYSGIEIGKNARGVVINRPMFFLNGETGGTKLGQEILITTENSGPVTISNLVTELYTSPLVRVQPSSGGLTNRNLLLIDQVNATNNFTATRPVLDLQGSGSTIIRNSRFGGGQSTSGAGGALVVRPPNADTGGWPVLITENVELYDGAYWDVETHNATGFIGWTDTYTAVRPGPGNAGEGTAPERVVRTKRTRHEFQRLTDTNVVAGVTIANTGHLGQSVWKATIAKEAFTAAAKNSDVYFATLPAKTRVVAAYADTTEAFTGTGLTDTITLEVGHNGATDGLLLAHDVKSGVVTKGLVSGDLGASMTAATQGAKVLSWSGVIQTSVTLRGGAGGGNLGTGSATNLTTGSVTVYLITETLP